MRRLLLLSIILATPALAEPSFTKDEAEAVFTLGQLTAAAQRAQGELKSFSATPTAKSALEKLNPSQKKP